MLSGVSYDPDGVVAGYTLPSGVAIAAPRDPLSGRITEVAARKDGAVVRRIGYGYDATGNIITIQDELPGDTQFQTFGYDGLHRLTSYRIQQNDASGPVLRAGAYTYDPLGNLLRLGEAQDLMLGYADAAHPGRLTSVAPPAARWRSATTPAGTRSHSGTWPAWNTTRSTGSCTRSRPTAPTCA